MYRVVFTILHSPVHSTDNDLGSDVLMRGERFGGQPVIHNGHVLSGWDPQVEGQLLKHKITVLEGRGREWVSTVQVQLHTVHVFSHKFLDQSTCTT